MSSIFTRGREAISIRARKALAALTAAALIVGLGIYFGGTSSHAAPTGFPDFDAECVTVGTDVPSGIVNQTTPLGVDNRLNTYVGGTLTIGASASELEGLTVVAGDVVNNKPGWFGIGIVGAGSLVVPAEGMDTFLVGGEISGQQSIDLGANRHARFAGEAAHMFPGWFTNYEENLGAAALITENYDPAFDFNDFTPAIEGYAENLAASGTIATVTRSGSAITLDGNNLPGQLRFDIDASDLAGVSEVNLINVESTQALVINVVGATTTTEITLGAFDFNATYTDVPADHVAVNGTNPPTAHATYPWRLNEFAFTGYATRIMWNFNDTGSITLTSGEQWIGSILAPQADLTASKSINGRIYVGGDFTFDGSGNEVHSFGWIGCGSLPTIDDLTGTFNIAKALTGDAAGLVDDDVEFTVNYSAVVPGEDDPVTDSLTILADGTVVDGPDFPAGTVVTFTEATPLPSVTGVVWGDIVITVDGATTNELTIADGEDAVIVVTNTANAPAPALGGFTITKAVENDSTGDLSGLEFTIEYSIDGGTTWEPLSPVADGGSQTVNDLPEGTVVQFREVTPTGLPAGVEWDDVDFSPASIAIEDGETLTVTATNTFSDIPAATGGFTITKVVENSSAGDLAGLEFTIEYSIDGGTTWETLATVADGDSQTVNDLPEGTVVQFREVTPTGLPVGVQWDGVAFSPEAITIEDGETLTVTATNAFSDIPAATGGFTVTKVVLNDSTDDLADLVFTIEYSIDGGDTWEALDAIGDGEAQAVTDLPEGTVVQFREVTPTGLPVGVQWDGVEFTPETITIGDGTTVDVVATNAFSDIPAATGGFTITKEIENDSTGDLSGLEFTIEYSTDGGDTWSTLDAVASGGSQTVNDLPEGTVVQFREVTPTGLPVGVQWDGVEFTPETVTIEDGETLTITATNAFSDIAPLSASVTISKVVTGEAAGLVDDDVEFTVNYQVNGGDVQSVTVTPGTPAVIDGLEEGDVVTLVSETDLPTIAGVVWADPILGAPVTLEAGDDNQITVTNTANEEPVVPTPTPTPSESPTPTPTPTTPDGDDPDGDSGSGGGTTDDGDSGGTGGGTEMPATGANTARGAAIAALLLGLGAALIAAQAKRTRSEG